MQTAQSERWQISSNRGRPQLRYLADGSSAGSNLTWTICRDGKPLQKLIIANSGRLRTDPDTTGNDCGAVDFSKK